MTLKKAQEIMELNLEEAGSGMPADCREAVRLSVEADKRINNNRLVDNHPDQVMLPGETEED